MNDVISQIVVVRSILVEVQFSGTIAAGNAIAWGDNVYLDSDKYPVEVYGIEAVTDAVLSTSPLGRPIVAAADAVNLAVEIVNKTETKAVNLNFPLQRLRPEIFNGYTQYFAPRRLDVNRTKVKIVAAGTITNLQSVCFNVYYRPIGN